MLQEQFDQMALILVDVCESYWPKYACPVLEGHSVVVCSWYFASRITCLYCLGRCSKDFNMLFCKTAVFICDINS